MRGREFASGHSPLVLVFRIVRVIEEFPFEGFAEAASWTRERVRQIGQTRDAALGGGCIAGVQNHASRDGNGRVLPVALLRTVLTGAHDHVRDVLCVGNVAIGVQTDFGKGIEARRTALLDRREFET